MDFRILGKLEVDRDGDRVSVGSFRQRSLLALLLIHANQVVSTDRILQELWGDELGPDRQNALWVHVSNLRSALEPERPRRSEGSLVLTRFPGYLLQLDSDAVDAWRFEELLSEGRALVDRDPAAASIVVAEALALWRGRAYEDFAYESFAQAAIGRLEELRLEAVELRLDADLHRGLTSELVGELEGLVRLHPLRERLAAQLMVALQGSGRRGDALRAYQRLRTRLGEELGIEPSDDLRRLEGRVLAGESVLERGRTAPGRQARLAVRGYELREQIDDGEVGPAYRAYQPTVGREVEIRVVRAELADDPDFIRSFEADAELIARLDHPHIVPLYDYWREPGAAYLVARLFRGGSADDVLRQGPLTPAHAAQVVLDVGSALSLVHRHGMVHGAVTPSNIVIDDDHRAYLRGFGIVRARAAAIDGLGTGVAGTARSDISGLARVFAAALLGRPVADPVPATEELAGPVADVIRRATADDGKPGYADMDSFTAAVRLLGAAPDRSATILENPYKGLRAFDEADAADFFGRERVVERLVARVGDGGTRGRLVVLVGPSGSGKSSTVKAGLLPALRGGALSGSAEWFVVDMAPGPHPFEALEAALLRIAVHSPAGLIDELLAGETGLLRAVERVLPDDRSQLLLVIDQFEELFTQAPAAVARDFLDALVAAVVRTPTRLRVVLTLRADFYDRPLAHRAFGELVRRGTEVIASMAPDELERAIDGPAERAGVQFEPGLVAQIVADVADRPGALPLLQFALTELFDRRRGQVIELATYHALDGVSGALVQRAEGLYERLDTQARATARQVLLRLVTIGEDAEIVRRRVPRHELLALGPSTVDGLLDTLGHHRLLSFDRDPVTRGPTVEIAHEALLSVWHRLRTWIDESREDVRHQRRLGQRAGEWLAAGRDDGHLLRGLPLDHAAAWAEATDLSLSPLEHEYLGASQARRVQDLVEDEQRSRGEERLRRTARRRSRLLVGSGAVLLAVVGVAALLVAQRGEAQRHATATDEARRLAAASALTAPDEPQLGMRLALQSLDVSARAGLPALPEAEDALHWAIQASRIEYPATDAPVEVRVAPKGLAGIYRLPLADLAALARGHLDRAFTPEECARFAIEPCPDDGAGLASPAATGGRPLPAATPGPALGTGTTSLAGTTITIQSAVEPDFGLFAELRRFEERTGIRVAYQFVEYGQLAAGLAGGDRPDLSILPIAELRELAEAGELLDLGAAVAPDAARRLVGDRMVDATTVGAGYFGVPISLNLKGLVWYRGPEFTAAGYTVPSTWDELIALSQRMVADGRTPWCIGLESGAFDGWPATDWIEALVLRIGGVDLYDRWVAHDIPFDHPAVAEATTMFGAVAFGDGFARGGVQALNTIDVWDAAHLLFDQPQGCWLNHQASFLPTLLTEDVTLGVDYDYFPLPPLQPGGETPAFGGASLLAAFADRPEVRELIRWTLDPEWGAAWAAEPRSVFLPANVSFDTAWCTTPDADPRTNALRVSLCEETQRAVASGQWRFDASDLMPVAIGTVDRSGHAAFFQGMTDYVDQGPGSRDRVLAAIEAAWPP